MFMHSVYIFNAEILKHFQSKDTKPSENSPYLQE